MGLKQLLIDSGEDFRQRSFGYGDNAPLITKSLPGVEENSESNTRNLVDSLTEGFIPGGALTAGEKAITDTKRISKFLLTKEGISFLATEVAGQRMNPQSLISPTNRTRTPLNLLAQIPSNIAGLHFRRDGVLDNVIENNYNYDFNQRGGKKYEKELRDILNSGEEGKRQTKTAINISGTEQYNMANIQPETSTETTDVTTTNPKTLLSLYNNFQISPELSIIKEYPGGADSTFGIGNTQIKKYENVGRRIVSPEPLELLKPIGDQDIQVLINKNKTKIRGLTQYLTGDPSINPSPDGTYTYNSPTVDRVNVADVFKRTSFEANEEAETLKDYIKFRIALVDTSNPLNDEVLMFRAFLENLNDNFTGQWNPHTYNGRAENFYTYSGFDREISFSFKVAPQSQIELKPLYKKLNYLVSSTAPEYVNRRMRGRYVRLTIGDWCYEVPGFFPNISLSWQNNFPWETNPDNEDYISQHPLILNVQCTFKPIHDFTPESKIDKPFIIRNTSDRPQWPNEPPAPIEKISPLPAKQIENNIPVPELQQQSQTNLDNAVDSIPAHTIMHKRVSYNSVIDYGYVNEVPDFSRDPNSISTLLGNLSNVDVYSNIMGRPWPPKQNNPKERSYTVGEQIEQKATAAGRSKFGMFM